MSYPEGLPRPQWDGYAIAVSGPAVSFTRDRGPSRIRNAGLGSLTTMTASFVLTDLEYGLFMKWYRDTTVNGTVADQMMVKNGKDDVLTYIKLLGPPQAEDLDGGWKVTIQAEVHSPARYTSAQIAAIMETQG